MTRTVLLGLFVALCLPAWAQRVADRIELDCNNRSEGLYSVLENGQIVLLANYDDNCEPCMDLASELEVFAEENRDFIRVWGAMGNHECFMVKGWEEAFDWTHIYAFADPDGYWMGQFEHRYIIIHPGTQEVYASTNDFDEAKYRALQLAADLGLTSVNGPMREPLVVNAYPNPFTDQLTVEIKNIRAQQVEVQVIDLQGRVLQQQQFRNALGVPLSINAGDLPSGTYFLSVRTETGTRAFKIFK